MLPHRGLSTETISGERRPNQDFEYGFEAPIADAPPFRGDSILFAVTPAMTWMSTVTFIRLADKTEVEADTAVSFFPS